MEVLTKILKASLALFRKYGFKAVTMDDLARHSGISKKTLYQHFANKEEVVQEVIIGHQRSLCEGCMHAAEESANAIEAYLSVATQMDNEFRQINPIAILELQRFFPSTYKVFKETIMEENIRLVRENIERGIEEGNYRAEIMPDLLARYRMESVMLIFQSDLLLQSYHIPQIIQELSEHFLYGMLTPKGEKLYIKYKEKYLKHVHT